MIHQFLKFEPILKEKIWGGNKLMVMLNKKSSKTNIGESWEISDVEDSVSVVAKGEHKGKSLRELVAKYGSCLVGDSVYSRFNKNFPLLIKFIDAKEKLSIQLHPDDDLAKERHNSFGKTEMWYIMSADKSSEVIVGFKKNSNQEEYLYHLKNKLLLNILNTDKVKKGDVYFIPTGRVHAIGSGVLLAEIQQTSDTTYRIYDWDRQDSNGNFRELHTDLAIDAIDYKALKSYKTIYKKIKNKSSEVVSCPYFTTNILSVLGKKEINHQDKDSFVIYICVEGGVMFSYKSNEEFLQVGETILVPACLKEFFVTSDNKSVLLEVYIK